MANYHEYAVREVICPEQVGLGLGDADGGDRICIALPGPSINDLAGEWQEINWISLTPECAKELHALLGMVKHMWEDAPSK